MSRSKKIVAGISGLVGGLMATAATVSPTDVDRNIATWLLLVGWQDPPRFLVTSNADYLVGGLGLALMVAAALSVWSLFMADSRNDPSSTQKTESSFVKGKIRNLHLENNRSTADNFVDAEVESLVAKGNEHDPGRSN